MMALHHRQMIEFAIILKVNKNNISNSSQNCSPSSALMIKQNRHFSGELKTLICF